MAASFTAYPGALTSTGGATPDTRRKLLDMVASQLKTDRASFEAQWTDLGDYILPTRPRWNTTDENKGDRRNLKIYNITATLAERTLESGMQAGMASPARPWFMSKLRNRFLEGYGPVKSWLHDLTSIVSAIYSNSNIYDKL